MHRDFVSWEPREFKFKIGKTLASSLSGFVAGVIFASIIWGVALFLLSIF